MFPTVCVVIQKLLSLCFPSLTLYPPVHLNLSYYKRLLKNIPMKTAQDYEQFLNATADISSSSNNGTAAPTGPLNSTQDPQGHGRSHFWRPFARKKYVCTTPGQDKDDIEMQRVNRRQRKNSRGKTSTAAAPNQATDLLSTAAAATAPPLSTAALPDPPSVDEHELSPIIHHPVGPNTSDLNEIVTA